MQHQRLGNKFGRIAWITIANRNCPHGMKKSYARVFPSYRQSSLLIESVLVIVRLRYNKNTFNSRGWNIQRYPRWVIDLSDSHRQTMTIISVSVIRLQWRWWQNNVDDLVKKCWWQNDYFVCYFAGVFCTKTFRKNTVKNSQAKDWHIFQVSSTHRMYLSLANHCFF